MPRPILRGVPQAGSGGDEPRPSISVLDVSGGMNNQQEGTNIANNQVTVLRNADIETPGSSKKRKGLSLVEDLGNDAGTGGFGFEPANGIPILITTHGQKLETNTTPDAGSSNSVERKIDFTTNLQTGFTKAFETGENDVFLVSNGTDNVFRFSPTNYSTPQDLGDTNTSPPLTTVMASFRNRVWTLKDDLLSYSDAAPSDYSTAFDRAGNAYRLPVGEQRAIVPIRDSGMIIIGSEQIWGINPSVIPAATDKPEKLLDIGCVAGKSAKQVGDDIMFLAKDGVRGVFRTQQDKLQLGSSLPISFSLKEEFDNISWGSVGKATAVWFKNKYILALPTVGSSYNNQVWVFYPATSAWSVFTGWEVGDWIKATFSGEERLFFIEANDGNVHEAFLTDQDNGSNFEFKETGRKENMGGPLVKKSGGELFIKAKATGSSSLTVEAEFDNGGFQTLGTLSLAGNLVDFTAWTLPMDLSDPNIVRSKYHLDPFGGWSFMRYRLTNTSSDDIEILERSIVTYTEPYLDED